MIGLLATALAAGLNMPCEQLQGVALERATVTAATTRRRRRVHAARGLGSRGHRRAAARNRSPSTAA